MTTSGKLSYKEKKFLVEAENLPVSTMG